MPLTEDSNAARCADAVALAAALQASRQDTLSTFAVFERALEDLLVPRGEALNPPLWELGHVGWFQEFWNARNPQRATGMKADPGVCRSPGVRADADALYDSGRVSHTARWMLPLPDACATRADLSRQLDGTLSLLRRAARDDNSLYFFRLALLHEDMHHEAALYMAQSLGVVIDDFRWQATALHSVCDQLAFEDGPWGLGNSDPGFAFDNELSAHVVMLPATHIDSRVLTWAEFLPFVEAGSYDQPQWWSSEGRAWIASGRAVSPRYTRRIHSTWQHWRHGTWRELDTAQAACHLTAFEAEAWCRWAGRRLPTEAEWERAALERPDTFEWGHVWEWTASPFLPYPGFEPHPYRDYSAPWFGNRTVLRGASFMTQARMRHPRYRNFFMPERNDVPAGFRTCRLQVDRFAAGAC